MSWEDTHTQSPAGQVHPMLSPEPGTCVPLTGRRTCPDTDTLSSQDRALRMSRSPGLSLVPAVPGCSGDCEACPHPLLGQLHRPPQRAHTHPRVGGYQGRSPRLGPHLQLRPARGPQRLGGGEGIAHLPPALTGLKIPGYAAVRAEMSEQLARGGRPMEAVAGETCAGGDIDRPGLGGLGRWGAFSGNWAVGSQPGSRGASAERVMSPVPRGGAHPALPRASLPPLPDESCQALRLRGCPFLQEDLPFASSAGPRAPSS